MRNMRGEKRYQMDVSDARVTNADTGWDDFLPTCFHVGSNLGGG